MVNFPQAPNEDEAELHHIIRGIVFDFSPRGMTLQQADVQTDSITRQILNGQMVQFLPNAGPNN